jgi:CrcB protein
LARRVALLSLMGAVGALARYWISGFVQRLEGAAFPWGTLSVNALACFLFGLIWSLGEERFLIGGETRLIVLTGFVGTFSTFSTYVFETTQLMRDSQWLLALANLPARTCLDSLR